MWYRCDFALPDAIQDSLFGPGRRNGGTFRRWVAKQNAALSLGLPPAVFNYGENGKTLNEHGGVRTGSAIRFGWYPNGMTLMAVGTEGVKLAGEIAPTIQSTLIRQSGKLIQAHVRRGVNTVGIRPKGFRVRYVSPSVVISPSGSGFGKWMSFLNDEKAAGTSALILPEARVWAERLMADQLKQQLRMHDECEEGVWQSDEDEFAASRATGGDWNGPSPFDVKIHSSGRPFLVDQISVVNQMIAKTHGTQKRALKVGFLNVELTINAELTGIWTVGRYLSHGHGMLFKAAKAWATDKEAA